MKSKRTKTNRMTGMKVAVPRSRLEKLVWLAERLGPEDLSAESDLIVRKWFGYRFMSPLDATVLFANQYRRAFKAYIAFHEGPEAGKRANGISLYDIWTQRGELTSTWRARQHADAIGMDYETYLRFCFEFASLKNRKRPPRPNQLRPSGDKQEAAWFAKFHKDRAEGTLLAIDRWFDRNEAPQYHFEAYKGLPAQNQYRQDLVGLLHETHRLRSDAMRKWSIERRQLPIRALLPISGDHGFKLALQALRSDLEAFPAQPVQATKLKEQDLHQSCFGIPHAQDLDDVPCAKCPQAKDCRQTAEQVLAVIEEHHGVADPEVARRRAQTRERVRRHRAKTKRDASTEGGAAHAGAEI